MKKILPIAITLALSMSSNAEDSKDWIQQETSSRQNIVKIYTSSIDEFNKASISLHADLLESDPNKKFIIADISDLTLSKLETLGLHIEPATQWLKKRDAYLKAKRLDVTSHNKPGIAGFECYATVEETFQQAQQLTNDHSHLAEWIDIGNSWQKSQGVGGYDLMVLKLTNKNITGNKPKLFIHSSMHAREYAPAALNLDFAKDLLQKYDNNADATWLLDHHEIHLLLQTNPDGRKQAERGASWRKNTNDAHCPGGLTGVDLNRNFTYYWNVTPNGSSGDACSNTYRGPSAGSEPETKAVENYVRSLFPDRRGPNQNDAAPDDTQGMHIDLHSYSELVLWPYGHTSTASPNGEAFRTMGRKLAYFNKYEPMQSVGLYPTDGTSDDVSYGELGVPAITFELGNAFFEPCSSYQNDVRPKNLPALYYAAKILRAPYKLPAGPDIYSISVNNNGVHPQIVAGTTMSISLMADDTRYYSGRNNPDEPRHRIEEAEVYVDTPPWASGAKAIALQAEDGSLSHPREKMVAQMETTNLSLGRHTLFFRAKDSAGNWGAVSAIFVTIGSNNSPNAAFTEQCTNLSCSFNASSSTDDGTINSYQWKLGDGTTLDGQTVSHTFASANTYSVELTVTDDLGATDVITKQITVQSGNNNGGNNSGSTNSGGGGGSLGWSAGLLLLLAFRRKK
ncbi:M14 family zinc carboxypeptidase [Pleionea sp. CnH1-48]|uniref:M14 family zinc carboxypeptidase n=1 Tax=Pleionea sp. CnH1-48 TaxID=2954494 RepID=UPI002097D5FE|nr:M14 family zinc carboxypeptidase [Pleionea sp. CnH1-48]MCO7225217.1 PKD domain-containing protein [Pleionea sp. CnH1-48]